MSKAAQVVIVIINALWLAPVTGGVSVVVGVIALIMIAGDR